MQTEVQISSESEECCPPESNVATEGGSLEIQTSSDNVVPPQPTKRPTRQWAAWTREEEESFFTALRQVGKNFEKITSRVQSKNRDQVRHYYYRVVRRMNKLLGPGLCLDAKNSKDTNAAMLRWWSLLEKYSCKASKLHLKPRRFKIFVDALEHQLIKDRKKNMKKRSSQGENCPPPLPSAFPNQNKSSGNDARAVKFVLVDSQNIQKGGQGKGTVVKRNVNTGVSRCCNKGDPSATKATRKRRKNGAVSAATLKRWEKAAMAGVSLVADAAEHLERTAGEKEAERQGASDGSSPQAAGCNNGQAQSPLENSPASVPLESNVQNTMKLKLQLFPIDDSTRKALEMDKHNPHLELTLSTRKKISSVLEHLNRKWGSSSVACGELMLFPFSVQRDNLMGYQRWTHGSIVSAADVYAMIGNPPVFRLRYGWILSTELHSAASQTRSDPSSEDRVYKNYGGHQLGGKTLSPAEFGGRSERLSGWSKNRSEGMRGHVGTARNDPFKSSSFAANILWQISEAAGGTTSREMNDVIDPRVGDKATSAAGEWADSLTNVSVGDLLTDASPDIDTNCVKHPVSGNPRCLDEMPFSCDSFDAAIAAHISRQQRNSIFQSGVACHSSSIWDAEETCDAFSFRKKALSSEHVASSSMATSTAREEFSRTSPEHSGCLHEDSDEVDMDEDTEADPMDECPSKSHEIEHLAKDLSSLTDIYWPDSLGPLELEVPSSKYYSEDMILSDSLSGLNRLIASSMDAFQNCSFFGLDSKGQSTGAGAEVSASSSGQKVGASSSGQKVGASSSGQKVGGGDNAGV